tara:strand:- start:671 stop:1222 length:552 start_codon:yes stop_codon:yes gene_type:complete
MATLAENLDLEIAHFSNFCEYLPKYKKYDKKTLNQLLDDGLLEVSTCFEHALAGVIGTTVISEDTRDLATGEDAKLSSVRTFSKGKGYSAPVTNISGKSGDLLVQVYERKQDNFYYFRIPNKFYKDIPSSSNIEIGFQLDGTPNKFSGRTKKYADWWTFECASFVDMCKGNYIWPNLRGPFWE